MRGTSARTVLKLGWDYPVYKAPAAASTGDTASQAVRRALSREDALAYIAGKDPRPLLVLRECKTCNGTDDALLSRGDVDNEKTFLLSRWFHCVKLPVDVLEKDHPFRNLFDAKDAEHMFLGTPDGAVHIALESERSRVELWGAMMTTLKASYASNPEAVLRKMERTIDDFDLVDQRFDALEQRIDQLLETEGPDSRKLKKVQDELAAVRKERDALFQTLDNATAELKLKKPATDKAAPKGA